MSTMTSADTAAVFRTATGLLETELQHQDYGFTWTHRLGRSASLPFSSIALEPTRGVGSSAIVQGKGTRRLRRYEINSGLTVLQVLQTTGAQELYELGLAWGQALDALHAADTAAASAGYPPPRTMCRAAAWIHGEWLPARDILGPRGLRQLADWAQRMLHSPRRGPVHGYPGMAHWIPAASATQGWLLSGEDTGYADPFYDYGWVLGELAELHEFHPALRDAVEQVRRGLLAQCPSRPDAANQDLACAYRLAQHAYDWHHYAGATLEDSALLLGLAARYLDSRLCPAQENP